MSRLQDIMQAGSGTVSGLQNIMQAGNAESGPKAPKEALSVGELHSVIDAVQHNVHMAGAEDIQYFSYTKKQLLDIKKDCAASKMKAASIPSLPAHVIAKPYRSQQWQQAGGRKWRYSSGGGDSDDEEELRPSRSSARRANAHSGHFIPDPLPKSSQQRSGKQRTARPREGKRGDGIGSAHGSGRPGQPVPSSASFKSGGGNHAPKSAGWAAPVDDEDFVLGGFETVKSANSANKKQSASVTADDDELDRKISAAGAPDDRAVAPETVDNPKSQSRGMGRWFSAPVETSIEAESTGKGDEVVSDDNSHVPLFARQTEPSLSATNSSVTDTISVSEAQVQNETARRPLFARGGTSGGPNVQSESSSSTPSLPDLPTLNAAQGHMGQQKGMAAPQNNGSKPAMLRMLMAAGGGSLGSPASPERTQKPMASAQSGSAPGSIIGGNMPPAPSNAVGLDSFGLPVGVQLPPPGMMGMSMPPFMPPGPGGTLQAPPHGMMPPPMGVRPPPAGANPPAIQGMTGQQFLAQFGGGGGNPPLAPGNQIPPRTGN